MRASRKDKVDDLCSTQELATERTEEHFACICHVMDVRVPELELAQDISCNSGDYPETLGSNTV